MFSANQNAEIVACMELTLLIRRSLYIHNLLYRNYFIDLQGRAVDTLNLVLEKMAMLSRVT